MSAPRPPCPSFTSKSALREVRLGDDASYARRNRSTFLADRDQIVSFLTDQWASELAFRLIKEIWAFADDPIAVRFAYEWTTRRATPSAPTETRAGPTTEPA